MPLRGEKNVKKLSADALKSVNDDIRAIYINGFTEIIKETPVDTGRARSNWFLSVGVPSQQTSAIVSNQNAFRQVNKTPKSTFNKKVYFSNNLPYIESLEYGGFPDPPTIGTYDRRTRTYEKRSSGGFSKQAPSGWVRKALTKMQNRIKALL